MRYALYAMCCAPCAVRFGYIVYSSPSLLCSEVLDKDFKAYGYKYHTPNYARLCAEA